MNLVFFSFLQIELIKKTCCNLFCVTNPFFILQRIKERCNYYFCQKKKIYKKQIFVLTNKKRSKYFFVVRKYLIFLVAFAKLLTSICMGFHLLTHTKKIPKKLLTLKKIACVSEKRSTEVIVVPCFFAMFTFLVF